MDYEYSPVENINIIQRILKPIKKIKPLNGKRILKYDIKNDKITRKKIVS